MAGRDDSGDIVMGAALGVLAGLGASYAMNKFQEAWLAVDDPMPSDDVDDVDDVDDDQDGAEPATVRTAEAVAEPVLGRDLKGDEKQVAGPAVHYGLGAFLGGVYGALAEAEEGVTAGAGTLYGAATWAGIDEAALPVLGLSSKPTAYPKSIHLYGLASHLVFGLALELIRRPLRGLLR